MWVGHPSARKRSVVPTTWLGVPGAIRRPHANRRARLAKALRDDPRITANASATLKWMCPPPRRRRDLKAAANFRRSDRNRTAFHRHTTSSSHRTRGLHPQVIECSTTPSSSSRSSHRRMPWSGLPVYHSLPEGNGRGLDSRKTRFLVAGFHTRFVPPSPFFATLAVYSSPRPPACFSRSRSWSSTSRSAVPVEGFPSVCRSEDLLFSRLPEVHRSSPSRGPPKRSRARPVPWQARKRESWCPARPPQLARSLGAVCCRIRLDRSCNPGGLGGVLRGGPRSVARRTIPPCNVCCLIRTEMWILPHSRKLRLVPRRSVALPEGGVPIRSGAGLRSRPLGRRPHARIRRIPLSRPEDRSWFLRLTPARCVGLGRRRILRALNRGSEDPDQACGSLAVSDEDSFILLSKSVTLK